MLSGIPELNNQYSGLRLSSSVQVQSFPDSSLRIQMQDVRFSTHNGEVNENEIKVGIPKDMFKFSKKRLIKHMTHNSMTFSGSFLIYLFLKELMSGSEEEIPRSLKTWLETPFKVHHKRGLVEKIMTSSEEPEITVNLKKAFVSQLQLDLSQSGDLEAKLQNQVRQSTQSTTEIPTFTSMETSVLGECETKYNINKLPAYLVAELTEEDEYQMPGGEAVCQGREVYEIVKSKNFDNCKERPVYHKTFGVHSRFDGSESTSHPSHVSVTRAIICGTPDSYLIRKVVTENKIISSSVGNIDTKENLEITSTSTLRLRSVSGISEEIPEPRSPKEYASVVYEYGKGHLSSESLKQGNNAFAPKPDVESAPEHLIPRSIPKEQIKQKVVSAIKELVRDSQNIDRNLEKNVAGVSTVISRSMHMLSYNDLKEIEQELKRHNDELIIPAFHDLLTVTATNPCIKLLKEKVEEGSISGEMGSIQISNAIRSIKTPTEEILEELVTLLKSSEVQRCRSMLSAVSLGLTEVVHRACVNQYNAKKEFPVQIYGEFCNQESKVVRDELEPYLIRELRQVEHENIHSAIVLINSLGNLGTERTVEALLEVVEGRITSSPHARSLAVYNLIRATQKKPVQIKTVLETLIENPAENTEVRIAAISVLPYTYPTAAELQKLAIRSWFEPSEQVASFIHSTLKSLETLPLANEFEELARKATLALPLCKPSRMSIQTSQSLQISHFVETLKTTVTQKLQWVSTEQSAFPKSIYGKTTVRGIDFDAETFESYLYLQGAESVIEKLYDLYATIEERDITQKERQEREKNMEEIREQSEKMNIETRTRDEKPEAHLTLKMLGLQKIYSLDTEMMNKIKEDIESAWRNGMSPRGISKEYFKVHDWTGLDTIFPTESGFPSYITRRTPIITYVKANLKPISGESKVEFDIKSIVTYKQEVQGGVITPITDKAHSAGVDYNVFAALPIRGEASYRHGQISVTLKKQEIQEERPLVQLSVRPFTTKCNVNEIRPAVLSSTSKTIVSREHEKKVNISMSYVCLIKKSFIFYKICNINLSRLTTNSVNPLVSISRWNLNLSRDSLMSLNS